MKGVWEFLINFLQVLSGFIMHQDKTQMCLPAVPLLLLRTWDLVPHHIPHQDTLPWVIKVKLRFNFSGIIFPDCYLTETRVAFPLKFFFPPWNMDNLMIIQSPPKIASSLCCLFRCSAFFQIIPVNKQFYHRKVFLNFYYYYIFPELLLYFRTKYTLACSFFHRKTKKCSSCHLNHSVLSTPALVWDTLCGLCSPNSMSLLSGSGINCSPSMKNFSAEDFISFAVYIHLYFLAGLISAF